MKYCRPKNTTCRRTLGVSVSKCLSAVYCRLLFGNVHGHIICYDSIWATNCLGIPCFCFRLVPTFTVAPTALKIAVDLESNTRYSSHSCHSVSFSVNTINFCEHNGSSSESWSGKKASVRRKNLSCRYRLLRFCQETYSVPLGYCFQWPWRFFSICARILFSTCVWLLQRQNQTS